MTLKRYLRLEARRARRKLTLAVGLMAPFGVALLLSHAASLEPVVFAATATAAAARIGSVDTIGLTVSDLDRSIDFYARVLTFEKVSDVEVTGPDYDRLQGVFALRMRVEKTRLGDEAIELMQYIAPPGRPAPPEYRSTDRWFQHVAIITSDMPRAYARLREHRVQQISPEPQRLPDWNPNAGGIEAFYFRDPDGHPLEILSFPPGKGAEKWHRTDRLFLGIDHTAISVSDTEKSLAFYRDGLGFRVAGESENYGPEQERLNSVFGAHLRITAVRAAAGPGIEFLQYLSPADGRPMAMDERANDLVHWQTRLLTRDAAAAARALQAGGYRFISPGVIEIPGRSLGFAKGFLVRDPDGHVMQIVEGETR